MNMTSTRFSAMASDAIAAFSSTAHGALDAYREGGMRLGEIAGRRWHSALRQANAKLTPETRKNAARAQKLVAACYAKSLDVSASGAEVAVDTLVKAAATAVARAAAFAQARNQTA
jgi:hypothetical protein